ncbi:MAG: hypothetical protein Q4A44_00350 [Bacteroidales bacterium]|nr:hypothetical protein [Bacteroidales bacterium]
MITAFYANFPNGIAAHDSVWEVCESSPKAKLKGLMLHLSKRYYSIAPALYSNWQSMLKGAQIDKKVADFWFEDANCDGIALCDEASRCHVVLVELKSTFSSQDIYKAAKQIVFSWLKIHMWLSLCPKYTPKKVKITAIIACLPPKDPAGFLDKVRRDEMLGKLSQDLTFTQSLYKTRQKVFQLRDFIKQEVQLSEMLVDIPFNVHLQLADTVESENCLLY